MIYVVNTSTGSDESYSRDIRDAVAKLHKDDLCIISSKDRKWIFFLTISSLENEKRLKNIYFDIFNTTMQVTNLSAWGINTIEIVIQRSTCLERIDSFQKDIQELIPFVL